ncbi:MAG: BlaI/MecI/CopY family transcriptional regulator [Solirubrobacteraceae bacterium]
MISRSTTGAFPPPLHELEREIMEIAWRLGRASVREVLEALNVDERQRAYTTVMTTMVRLWEKGVLNRERRGRADIYEPVLSAEQYRQARAVHEVEALIGEYGDVALAQFARQVGGLDAERLARLRELAGE